MTNPAATLTDALEEAVRDGLAYPPALIVVEGEEDLAVLPLALAAPDGAALVYGQPGAGGRGLPRSTPNAGHGPARSSTSSSRSRQAIL